VWGASEMYFGPEESPVLAKSGGQLVSFSNCLAQTTGTEEEVLAAIAGSRSIKEAGEDAAPKHALRQKKSRLGIKKIRLEIFSLAKKKIEKTADRLLCLGNL